MSGTSVFPSVVAVISNYCVQWFKWFQTDVALRHPTELSLLFQCSRFHWLLRKHIVESLGFLLNVIAKDFHAVLCLIKPLWILDLSIHTSGVHTKSGGDVAVDFPGVGGFRIEFSLILQTLKNHFKVGINDEENFELVLPTMESHEGILFRHVYHSLLLCLCNIGTACPWNLCCEILEGSSDRSAVCVGADCYCF